ncbi:MAG: phage protein Gp36 family protein [Ginsengibacter sp.]
MYVEQTDYKGRISSSLLDILIAEDPAGIIADASAEAEGTIATFAGVLYDIAPELAKTAAARNGYLLSLAKSIGLYFIYQRADDEDVPEKVIKNYDDAMHDLEKISIGKKLLALPPVPVVVGESGVTDGTDTVEGVGTQGVGLLRIGSQTKRTHQI